MASNIARVAATTKALSTTRLAAGTTTGAAVLAALEATGQVAEIATNVVDIGQYGENGIKYAEKKKLLQMESEHQREEDMKRAAHDPVGEDFVPAPRKSHDGLQSLDTDIHLDPLGDDQDDVKKDSKASASE